MSLNASLNNFIQKAFLIDKLKSDEHLTRSYKTVYCLSDGRCWTILVVLMHK